MTNVNTSTTSTASTDSAATPVAGAKKLPAIYTPLGTKGRAIALWLSEISTPRAPMLTGLVDGKPVSAFIRKGVKGIFLDVVGAKMENGYNAPVATARMVTNPAGIPKSVMTFKAQGETVFAEVSLSMPKEALIACGLQVDVQDRKLAEAAVRRADKAQAAAKEPVAA